MSEETKDTDLQDKRVKNFFEKGDEPDKNLWVRHGGYWIYSQVITFFSNPYKRHKRELDLLDKAGVVLDPGVTDENLGQVNQLVQLHRNVENTKARRRLEKWSLRVIAWYLFIVFLVVIASYYPYKVAYDGTIVHFLNVPNEIMITILSTTTVNIIGLGLIVLRGHFLAKDIADDSIKNKG